MSERMSQDISAFQICIPSAHQHMAKICLLYLLSFNEPLSDDLITFDTDSTLLSFTSRPVLFKKFPLLDYLATPEQFWLEHHQAGVSGEVQLTSSFELTKRLFSSDVNYVNWLRMYDPDVSTAFYLLYHPDDLLPFKLYYASLLGLLPVVSHLIGEGADVNTKGGVYGNALQATSFKGHEQVVRFLVDKGADVNANGGFFANALQAAIENGHEGVVRFLVDKGADVNARALFFEEHRPTNPLQAGIYRDNESMVRLLVELGADVNANGGMYGNVLQAASCFGLEPIVRFLVENGAKVNASGGKYGNALKAALDNHQKSVVRFLVENGADVNDAEVSARVKDVLSDNYLSFPYIPSPHVIPYGLTAREI
jgi:hypothetical protein